MAVNLKDDYEKLAKLLYPSIEASGNVYYGTTRKLTIDALLDKTDIGFESHVESENYEGIHYIPRFYWKLGPLSSNVYIGNVIENGIINANTFDDGDIYHYDVYRMYQDGSVDEGPITGEDPIYGTFFAKYKLVFNTSKIDNLTNNSNFPTYESSVSVGDPECIIVTDNFDPSNPTGYNIYNIENRHFYITKEVNDFILYIQIASCKQPSYIDEFKNEPITFESHSIGHFNSTVSLRAIGGYDTSDGYTCQYRTYKEDLLSNVFLWSLWTNYTLGTSISLSALEKVQFRCNGSAPQQTASNHYLTFDTTGRLTVYGNVMSLLDEDFASAGITYYKCGLRNLFGGCSGITDATNLVLNSDLDAQYNYLYNGSYDSMFYGCSDLKYAPKELPATSLLNNPAYEDMFQQCSNLETAPKIKAITLSENCCRSMFANCSNLVSGPEILPADSLATMCYYGMFSGCTSLEVSPKLPATSFGDADLSTASPYEYMFNGCTSLNKVYINLVNSLDDIDGTYFLEGTSSGGDFIVNKHADWIHCTYYNDFLDGNWSLVVNNIDDSAAESDRGIYFYSHSTGFCCTASHTLNTTDYMITSGTDSPDNGRGYISDESTIYNMEESFDENHTHSFDEFNVNGSYNQEIWGYKSFNSPVLFRNGVYGDNFSLITEPAQCTFSYRDGDNDEEADIQLNVGSVLQCKVKDTGGINYMPASKVYQYSAASEEYEISDVSYVDYATENDIYSTLYGNDLLYTLGHGYEKVYECAATRTMAKTYTSANSPVQTIQRYVTNMSSGESYISIISEYDENHTYLANSSSIRLALYDNVDASGITESSVDILNRDFTKSADDIEEGYYSKYESKSTTLTNGILYDESDELPYNCLKTGSILEIENGVNTIYTDDNEVFATIDMPHIVAKSKQFMGPGHDLDEALLIISGMSGASSQAILQTTSNRVSNSHTYIGTVSIRDISTLPGSIQLKSEVISDDPNETWDSKSAQIDLTYNGCEINQVPIGPIKRTFSNNPVFTKGSVHILIITSFGSAVSAIHCGDIIKSATVQGSNIWCVNKALVTLSVGLSTLAINASGVTSTVSLSAGGNNSSVMFKVLSNRYPTDTDKSLIVVCMTDDSLA